MGETGKNSHSTIANVTNLSTRVQVFSACCFFILAGFAIIPYLGIQNDEALFAAPLYLQNSKEFSITVWHRQIPLMVMTYIGTLKSLLYLPIFSILGASVWTLRVPMVLCGALTIFFFFKLASRAVGSRGAAIGAFLLATDPSFLMTNTVDWGPVALSQFFLVTGCFCLLRFAQSKEHSMRDLAIGFFLLGLGLWNKALFFWILAGLCAGAIVIFPGELKRLLSWRRAVAAALAFAFGAFPFLLFNIRQPNATLAASAHFDSPRVAFSKWRGMETAVRGSALFGYFTTESWEVEHPKAPSTVHGKIAVWIEQHAGEHRGNGMEYALVAALLAAAWARYRRAALFSLVFMGVVWGLMAFTHDAGVSVHHCVLLWPFPQFLVAIALACIPWRAIGWLVAALLVAMNLWVIVTYIAQFERNGAGLTYSDAIYPLSDALKDSPDPAHRQPIWMMDWGMLNPLALLHQGRLELRSGDPLFATDHPSAEMLDITRRMLDESDALFVGHAPGRDMFPDVRKRLDRTLAATGKKKIVLQTISDSNGRPTFEIFQIR